MMYVSLRHVPASMIYNITTSAETHPGQIGNLYERDVETFAHIYSFE